MPPTECHQNHKNLRAIGTIVAINTVSRTSTDLIGSGSGHRGTSYELGLKTKGGYRIQLCAHFFTLFAEMGTGSRSSLNARAKETLKAAVRAVSGTYLVAEDR